LSKLLILSPESDRIVGYADEVQARRMLRLRQARPVSNGRRAIRLTFHHEMPEHPCRTHTSRGGVMGAIGRSQGYTVAERDRVTGFKTIFPEDRHIFHTATIDCMAAT
jgi:hypothetical protein